MHLHRFIGPFDLDQPQITLVEPELVRQITKVLKLTSGESLILCDQTGAHTIATISSFDKTRVVCSLEPKQENQKDKNENSVHLYCAILKKENFEWVVQKATEVGVTTITPLLTDRTVKQNIRPDRLEKIAHEAAEQSGRTTLPTITDSLDLKTAIDQAIPTGPAILFDVTAIDDFSATNLKTGSDNTQVNIFIGPEGGFTSAEVEYAKEAGATISSLGSLVLRGETAAIIASYRAVHGI